jgi:hypothetical protein
MNATRPAISFQQIIPFLFFVLYFLYFFVFNRYLLIYHEQIQLFRFNLNYFKDFLSGPGGLMKYIGAFLTQFFLFPLAGASIITLAGFSVYSISLYIFRKHRIYLVLQPLVPVLFLASMQSHYLYTLDYTLGLIVTLGFFAVYISISNINLRYSFGIFGWPLLYFLTGGYALVSSLICVIHEILFNRNRSRFMIALAFPILSLLVPYLASHHIFYIKASTAWTVFLPLFIEPPVRYILILLLIYYPLVLLASKVWMNYSEREMISMPWNWKTIVSGILVIVCLAGWMYKYIYDRRTEIWLGMDHYVQNSDWDGALKLSSIYPGTNRLVMYFTNLALYKSGHMGDKLFQYPQAGISGLWLNWERNGISPFFGGEIYYQLAYISEAYRWAFESMVAKGPNPRSLKRLVVTSLVNRDILLAEKYLKVLDQSLFYRSWAQHYHYFVDHPEHIIDDKEMAEKIHFEINTDFMSSRDNFDIRLDQLLENHPDNRMAFEYIMSSLLLDKNLSGFAANIYRLKELGYKSIPVHYEEALLAYMSYSKKDIIPAGYSISITTQTLFSDYAKVFFSLGDNPDEAARVMYSRFGKTYWYYLKFINNNAKQKNAKQNK